MGELYAQSGITSSTIYVMTKKVADRESKAFGSWLAGEIRRNGMNQSEFAAAVGVGTSTVSRWVNGRIPEATLIERIADILILDYDAVATKAGYRPRVHDDHEHDLERLVAMLRAVNLDRDGRRQTIEGILKMWIDFDRANRKGE